MNKLPACLLMLMASAAIRAQNVSLSSPDGKIEYHLHLVKGHVEYSVNFGKQVLIDHSPLSLNFENNDHWGEGLSLQKVSVIDGEDNYSLPAGKTSEVHDRYREAIMPLVEKAGKNRRLLLHVRIFNDGVAFRYEFPSQNSWKNLVMTDEHSSFNLVGNPLARVAFLENFTTSHEHRYNIMPLREIKDDTLMDMPALFEFPGKIFMAITEANLLDYAGMSLRKQQGLLGSQLSPLPGQTEVKVKANLPHHSPWRVMMIGDRIGKLIESNMLTSLAEPCRIRDLSWLKPGKASFHWWNGDVLPDTTFEAGINFAFNQYYIDFCARNGIEYHTIIGNRGVAWYQNDGVEYQPGQNTDVTKPRPGLNIPELCEYAAGKGVGIRFWVHWKALYPKLDSAFTLFQQWGVKGMMVDFMDRDDQEMVRIQEEILQKAAEHHLEIQFHGAYKPTGLSRTYPNESTREGTLNYENDKWGNLITPDDDIEIPFTRGLAGPTDYHLGGFRAQPANAFKVQVSHPHVLGTRCHMLAMYVILENHLSMVCDDPSAYEGQDGFDFLKRVPTIWDQTVVPGAETGQWLAIARRKGNSWYLGVINNSIGRQVQCPLNFLPPGRYQATIYSDAADVDRYPDHLLKQIRNLSSGDQLAIDLPAGGGQVVIIEPAM